jgi:hypothetical protein
MTRIVRGTNLTDAERLEVERINGSSDITWIESHNFEFNGPRYIAAFEDEEMSRVLKIEDYVVGETDEVVFSRLGLGSLG